MKSTIKKLLSPLLAISLTLSLSSGMLSYADVPAQAPAVYSKSDMSFSGSAKIKGDAIIASGSLSGGNNPWATGNIYMASSVQLADDFAVNRDILKQYSGNLVSYSFQNYADFPETTYFRDKDTDYKDGTKDVVIGWSGNEFASGYTISSDSFIRNLTINYGLTLNVNVPSGQIRVIRVDTLATRGNIVVNGGGKLILYTDHIGDCSNALFNATNSDFGSPDSLTIVADQGVQNANLNSARISASIIWLGNDLSLKNTIINGRLFAKGDVSLYGTAQFQGLVFAPNSGTILDNSAYIIGRLITNELIIKGSCYVQTGDASGLPSDVGSIIGDNNSGEITIPTNNTTATTTSQTTQTPTQATTQTPTQTTTQTTGQTTTQTDDSTTTPSTQTTNTTSPTNPTDPDDPTGDTVQITVTVARRMSIRLADGRILKSGDKFTMPKYGTIRFQVCTNNWDTNTYTDDGQGIAGQKVYEYTNQKNKELYLRVDNNRYFAPVKFHFVNGDYGKQTGVDNVLSKPLESLSINFPLGATIAVKAYVKNQVVETKNIFVDSSLQWVNWNY